MALVRAGVFLGWRNKFLIGFLIFETLCLLSVLISPSLFWPIGLLNYAIPFLIAGHIVLCVYLIAKWKLIAWMYILFIPVSCYFYDTTFNFPSSPVQSIDRQGFDVLSFNARLFRVRKDYGQFSSESIHWAVNEPADIKCFQEYCSNPDVDSIDITSKMIEKGYNAHVVAYPIPESPHQHGLAIFSKFPIVEKGTINLNDGSINNCIFADVVIESDTVRIFNFHLNSMGLKLHLYKQPRNFKANYQYLLSKLGTSSAKRAREIDRLMSAFDPCPYPMIVVGDFNELPYGNNYYRMKTRFSNAFETCGSGFGFTFNHKLFFLRIDHQFYSGRISANTFKVLRNIPYSDHFPVKATYHIKECQ